MMENVKKYRQLWLVLPIVICLGIIMFGGINYMSNLRDNLTEQAIGNVLTVTHQQQQAFDSFIAGDREQLHDIADFLVRNDYTSAVEVQRQLSLFHEADTVYSVVCLDESWFCSNTSGPLPLTEEQVGVYRALEGSGVRDTFVGIFSGVPRFSFYESFTFSDGKKGLIQKSYDRSKVSESFSLSFYNDQGFAYVVNQKGDILLRGVRTEDHFYENIYEILTGGQGGQTDIDRFSTALDNREPGTVLYEGSQNDYILAYVPMEAVDNWFLVSVVDQEALAREANEILMDSQQALMLLSALLVFCAVFIIVIWYINRAIGKRDHEIGYQAALINIFSTYLSRNTDNVLMLLDAETVRLDYTSPNMERVLGVSQEQMAGSVYHFQPRHLIPEAAESDSSEEHLARLCRLEAGTEVEDINLEWVNPQTQEQLWLVESVYCTQVQDRKKLVFSISDRTQERRVQNRLSEALQMARAANEAKTAFLGNVSHDIRTPMNAILGFTNLLDDEAENPAVVREYAQRIAAAGQHLLSLINDVLDINKIESGSTTLNLVDIDLAEIIEEINAIIRPQTKAKDQTFDILVSPLNYEQVQGDKLRLNQILINLLSNSVKYTPAGGRIEMRVEELSQTMEKYSRVRFTVSDNGMGMSEEYLKVIFDPFTREETKETYGIQGTGLGMAITKSLVDLMGGSIKVDSKLGEGSAFTVELALRIQEQEDDPQFWVDHGVKRVLAADDNEDARVSITRLMAPIGVEVDCAASGESAFDILCSARKEGRPYDIVLLDWKMPNLSGLDTARLIRERYPERIPILLLTAYDWSEIEEEAKDIGIDYFMPKPFFISTFKNAIGRIMGDTNKREKKEENSDVVKGKHILVVDDIEVNRIILVKILSTLGATCETAGNGQEAVEAFERSRPGEYDLILMDVQMPVMNGYEATRTIRGGIHPSAREIPIIAMTANAFVDDVRDAIESGMDAHIAKPVQIDNLKSTIQQVLDSRSNQPAEPKKTGNA